MFKTCLTCGKEFSAQANQPGHYCSRACAGKAQRRLETRICPICKNPFECRPSSRKTYCTRVCFGKATGQRCRKEAPIRICKFCGKSYQRNHHRENVTYCSRKCSDMADKNAGKRLPRITKTCPMCGKQFETLPYRETTYCSTKCSSVHTAQWRVGENHPLYKPKVPMRCEVCGALRMVKPSLASRFRACSRRCAAILCQQAWPRISSIEQTIMDALTAKGLSFVSQQTIGPFIVDVAFPERRLAIECDGTYWHGLEKQQRKDHSKDHYLWEQGWKVIRLPEDEIRHSLDSCVAKILAAL